MTGQELAECLRLLDAADRILMNAGESILAAHLSAVIEPLRGRSGGIIAHQCADAITH